MPNVVSSIFLICQMFCFSNREYCNNSIQITFYSMQVASLGKSEPEILWFN